jgi:hypothetical protein
MPGLLEPEATVKATVEQLLLGCTVLAFGLGWMVGSMKSGGAIVVQPQQQGVPNNYDSARQIANDAIKAAQDSQHECWTHMQELLVERRGAQAPAGH